MKKVIIIYFVLCGLFIAVSVPVGFIYVLRTYSLTPNQFLVKSAEKLSISDPRILALLEPAPRYADHVLDGSIKPGHPRILALDLKGWSGVSAPSKALAEKQAYFSENKIKTLNPCHNPQLLWAVACWVLTGDQNAADTAVALLQKFRHYTPDANQDHFGNAWEVALAYDLLSVYPGFSENARAAVNDEIRLTLRDYLRLLDDDSPSLWHARASLASNAWLSAVALDGETEEDRTLIARAQGHFLDAISAYSVTEAWPEGYNYWIQNRAFLLALGASAYINGVADSALKGDLVKNLEQASVWPLYAMRPDNRIENLGDEGSRVDLKDETRRVIDVFAQTLRNPTLAAFSSYLGKLHGDSYYPEYLWGFWLFNEPGLLLAESPKKPWELDYFDKWLPKSRLFGRQAMNLAYIRSGWKPDATFISYQAGHSFTHHGHYGAGHFSLYKGAPLAVNSSSYGGGMFSPNRLNYSIRTISRNSLLILRPGEKVEPNRFFDDNVSDGGQRITMPTGSAIRSLEEWRENLYGGKHFEGGELLAYDSLENVYTYIASDLTGAYNSTRFDDNGKGGKVRSVKRELLYLNSEDRLIVRDRVETTDPDYQVKWLLHTVNKPRVEGLRVLKGKEDDGILSSASKTVSIANPPGFLKLDWLLPKDGEIRLVGGPNYRYYVEADGDEALLDGQNFSQGASDSPWFEKSLWRVELNAPKTGMSQEYLVVLSPSLNKPREEAGPAVSNVDGATLLFLPESAVIFLSGSADGQRSIHIGRTTRHLYVVGELALRKVSLDGSPLQSESRAPKVFHVFFSEGVRDQDHIVTID